MFKERPRKNSNWVCVHFQTPLAESTRKPWTFVSAVPRVVTNSFSELFFKQKKNKVTVYCQLFIRHIYERVHYLGQLFRKCPRPDVRFANNLKSVWFGLVAEFYIQSLYIYIAADRTEKYPSQVRTC